MTVAKKYEVGSLFAGVGGICLGFKQATHEDTGFNINWANEIDEHAAVTYRTNFDHELIVGDIEKIINPSLLDIEKEENIKMLENESDEKTKSTLMKKISESDELKLLYEGKRASILKNRIDVLMGGFPCQAFSIAGEAKGFDDHRGNLFWSFINIVNLLEPIHGKPRILFLENVKNLKGHDDGKTYLVIKSELEKAGYIIKEKILNTMDYSDLPQNRERIYIVGFLNKDDADKFTMFDDINKFFKSKTPLNRMEDVKKVLDPGINKENGDEYYYTKKKYPGYFISKEEYIALPEEDRKNVRVNLEEQISEEYQFYQVRRGMYVRKNMSNVCPTLTANMGTGGHNVPLIKVKDGIRKLTPAETFKLQGFPIGNGYTLPSRLESRSYPNSSLYKQAGNAVSVPVVRMIAEEILKILK